MRSMWMSGLLGVAAAALVFGLLSRPVAPALADEGKKHVGPARYNVVETAGHNLLVTDNSTNMMYFYTVDKDKPVGSDLKLRGSIDLTQVGKPVIRPTTHKAE
jgi:hypothetical protein